MGWQRDDPSSDFRGAGFAALENLLYLARVSTKVWFGAGWLEPYLQALSERPCLQSAHSLQLAALITLNATILGPAVHVPQ